MAKSGDELGIGVIGAGARGWLSVAAHRPGGGSRIVAAADVDEKPLARYREKYGEETFTTIDYRELLARGEVDAVFVSSPDYLHEEHAVASLEAGKAVYLEKPMAITIKGCDRILRAAKESGARLYLGHNMRHMAFVLKMKELIDSGAIGEVRSGWCRHFVSYGGDSYFKDYHAERAAGTGLLLQKGSHDIDILHWLCGGYSKRVTAMGGLTVYGHTENRRGPSERADRSSRRKTWPPLSQAGMNPKMDVEDLSLVLMELDNGAFASYEQCHYTPDAWRNYTIIGTEGRIENFGDFGGECVIRLWNRREDRYRPEGDEEFVIAPDESGHGGADADVVAEFLRYVREGGATRTSPVAARMAVAAGVKATESLRDGAAPKDVPPLAPDLAAYFEGGGA